VLALLRFPLCDGGLHWAISWETRSRAHHRKRCHFLPLSPNKCPKRTTSTPPTTRSECFASQSTV
jgi:hypothetical protein